MEIKTFIKYTLYTIIVLFIGIIIGYFIFKDYNNKNINNNVIIQDTTYNHIVLDSIRYNIKIKDSIIKNIRYKYEDSIVKVLYIDDSSSFELFKRLVSEP